VRFKRIVAPVLAATLFGALLIHLPLSIAARASDYDLFDPVIEIRALLKQGYAQADKVNDEKMRDAMIQGMIETLNDPHTVYVPPSNLAEFNKELRGTYVGIGAEINIINDYLTIVSPMDGSPALEAGVMAGDVVLTIEDKSTFKMPVDECIATLMGEPGTNVNIRVRHLDGSEQDLSITRRQITTRTVKGLFRTGESWNYCVDSTLGIAYVHVTQFNETTMDELNEALETIEADGLNGLILDLRGNPGGGFPQAVGMSDLFLESGTIVSVRPRVGEGRTWTAQSPGTLPDFPMIVLVNGFSASASEIVAGALQENGRAKVMGTRTFGKGSVQEVHDLEFNHGSLKYTTALYYLPSGRNINRSDDSTVWGVDPDPGFMVPVTDEQYIEHLRAARDFEIIRKTNGNLPECASPSWIREKFKDEQLAKAIEALQSQLTGLGWPSFGNADAAREAVALDLQRTEEARARVLDQLDQLEEQIERLQGQAETTGSMPLLPSDIDLLNGMLTVTDKNGNVIGTYRIEGGNLELALGTLELTPLPEPDSK